VPCTPNRYAILGFGGNGDAELFSFTRKF